MATILKSLVMGARTKLTQIVSMSLAAKRWQDNNNFSALLKLRAANSVSIGLK